MEAARNFEMNTDFDLAGVLRDQRLDLVSLLALMKDMSAGKMTIQAMADKLMLHRMIDNLGVPQLPLMLVVENGKVNPREVEHFIANRLCGPEREELVGKPTHMSNASGVVVLSPPEPHMFQALCEHFTMHIQQHLVQKAGAHESVAMQQLKPGFVVQPKYQSVVNFKTPLELRVVVLWGKARLAVWWWGHGQGPEEHPGRNTWFVRCPIIRGELNDADQWQVVHQHVGRNVGFERALELFKRHLPSIIATAEGVACAFGAPFLRVDFFVGSPRWGVRLNEVAYGCGCDYRNIAEDGSGRIVDDAPTIAQILQEGMSQCTRRLAPSAFLGQLGVCGHMYHQAAVTTMPPRLRPYLPPSALRGERDEECRSYAVPDELCQTMHQQRALFAF